MGLQDRVVTYADELRRQRERLIEIKKELENLSNTTNEPDNRKENAKSVLMPSEQTPEASALVAD